MGRRKLTKILLESGCNKNLRNKQKETAKDIATRKDLTEILAILNNSSSSRSSKKYKKKEKTDVKEESSNKKDKKRQKVHFSEVTTVATNKNWSPYGCHYYPDPKSFPSPKLDSLPPDPLQKGEQYFLDLAGNICKGPVGVGYTCYCAPFFRHMEEQLEKDKLELQNKIEMAEQRLDKKVQNLERRTETRLSQLKLHQHHLAKWLRSEAGLHRTRSLDMLLDGELSAKIDTIQLNENTVDNVDQTHHSMDNLSNDDWLQNPANVPKDSLGKFWRSQFSVADRNRCPDLVSSLHSHNSQTSDPLHYSKQDSQRGRLSDKSVKTDNSREKRTLSERKRRDFHKSVGDIVSRSQYSQPSHWHDERRLSSREDGEGREDGAQWCGAEGFSDYNSEWRKDVSSDSSEGEDNENISSWPEIKRLPYRSRNAVYSPPLEREPNDSGYSTKMCSNSQGPSPSLSGRLESDTILTSHPAGLNYTIKSADVIPTAELSATKQLTSECQNIYTGEASLV